MTQDKFFIQVGWQKNWLTGAEWYVIREYETSEELDDIDYSSQEAAEQAVFNKVRKSNRRYLPHMPSMSKHLREFHEFATDHLQQFGAIPVEFEFTISSEVHGVQEFVWDSNKCWEMAINLGIIPVTGIE